MNNEVSSLELLLLVGPNNSSLLDFSNLVYWVFFFFIIWKIPLHYVQQSTKQTKRGGKREEECFAQCNDEMGLTDTV